MSDEFDKALHCALRRQDPGEDFSARIVARLDSTATPLAPAARVRSMPRRVFRTRWLPAALAAGIIAAIGLIQLRQHALDTARANQARAQLLQALSIARDNINIVRSAVAREENPNS
jgi:serine/threonine protein kinase HipA of HipAB toxin-antitoxin module